MNANTHFTFELKTAESLLGAAFMRLMEYRNNTQRERITYRTNLQSIDWQTRFRKFEQWLYAPSSSMPLFLRSLGAVLMISGLWQLSALTIGPFSVSPWSINGQPLELSRLPLVADMLIYCIYFGAAACLILGRKSQIPLILVSIIFVSTASREIAAITSNFQYILLTYAFAALFAYTKKSCTARLVQLSLSSCYFFAVIHKLSPEFLSGHTLWAVFVDGWGLREFWIPLVQMVNPSLVLMQVLSIIVVLVEAFLAWGLCFKATRRAAVLVGIALHLTLSIFLTVIDYASLVMLLGYVLIWGLDARSPRLDQTPDQSIHPAAKPTPASEARVVPGPGKRKLRHLCPALAVALFIVLAPLRGFLPPLNWLPIPSLDPMIGNFGMFSEKCQIDKVEIDETVDERVMPMSITGRMGQIGSEREVLSLARYFARTTNVDELKVKVRMNINNRWTKYKTFTAKPSNESFVVDYQEQSVRSADVPKTRNNDCKGKTVSTSD